jgi:hypothetical protein
MGVNIVRLAKSRSENSFLRAELPLDAEEVFFHVLGKDSYSEGKFTTEDVDTWFSLGKVEDLSWSSNCELLNVVRNGINFKVVSVECSRFIPQNSSATVMEIGVSRKESKLYEQAVDLRGRQEFIEKLPTLIQEAIQKAMVGSFSC